MPRARTIREIEVKIRIADLPALIAKLRKLRARCDGRVFEQNTLYDTPEEDFRRAGRLLRLRTEMPAPAKRLGLPGGARKAVVTSKAPALGPGSRYKERLEREVVIRNPAKWPANLRALGLRPGFRYEKYRTTFRLPGLHLDFDETSIGTFLELEGGRRAIDRAARALGFSPRDYIRATYWDLFQASRKGGPPGRRPVEPGGPGSRAPRNMTFRA
jgi:adenylate cyclase, class 2